MNTNVWKKALAVGIILLFIGTGIIPSTAQDIEKPSLSISRGNWLYVGGDGPGNYSRIQDAINAAVDGDTVFVFHGIYSETVVVNKSIRLIGENKENTSIARQGLGIHDVFVYITADNVIFTGFTVKNTWQNGGEGIGISIISSYSNIYGNHIINNWGIELYKSFYTNVFNNSVETKNICIAFNGGGANCSYNCIYNNNLTNQGTEYRINSAIYIEEAANNIVRGNHIYDSLTDGIQIDGYRYGRAINNTIINNTIECQNVKTSFGILLAYNPHALGRQAGNPLRTTVIGNTISNCEYGILVNCNSNIIAHNIIRNNTYGIDCVDVGWMTINENTVEGNTYGISVLGSMFFNITANIVAFNKILGIDMEDFSNNNTISHNKIHNNSCGLFLLTSSHNKITSNTFIQNKHDVKSLFSRERWKGNYWNEPRTFPKLIFGIFPFIQIDWRPAKETYDIGG